MKNCLKKNISIAVIIISSLLFLVFERQNVQYYRVLDVIEGDKIYIDLNYDGKSSANELFHLKNVNTFPKKYNSKLEYYSKRYDITEEEALYLGQKAFEYTKNKLLGREIAFIKEPAPYNPKYYYRFAEISLNDKNFGITLLEEGLAFAYEGKGFNPYKTYENLKKIKKNAKMCGKSCLKSSIADFKNNEKNQGFKQDENTKTIVYTDSPVFASGNVEIFLVNPNGVPRPSYMAKTKACKVILDNIRNAQNSIDFALYGLDKQDDILKALIEAKNRGIKIRGVVDSKPDNSYVYNDTAKLNANFDTVADFKAPFMHNKFFIFDEKSVITGTMNVSATGCSGYNANTVVLINNSSVARVFTQEFNQMYAGKFQQNKEDSSIRGLKISDKITLDVYFSPVGTLIYQGILPIIHNAREEIFVSIFYLTNKEIINALIAAKRRGVDVKIIHDAVGANNMKEKIRTLRVAGIYLKVENWGGKDHEKNMVIDGKYFITGSANFSYSGAKKNDENVLIFKSTDISGFYRKHFLNLYNSIDNKYLKITPRAESFESGNSCYDGIDNNFDGKIDSGDIGCKR